LHDQIAAGVANPESSSRAATKITNEIIEDERK
jgi:hypothetical protein